MSPPFPMDALCRVCHKTSPLCLSLFKPLDNAISGKLATLASILSYCSGLEILEAELFLPHHICPGCVAKLQLSLEFKRSVHRMDRILRQSHAEFCCSKRISAVNTGPRMSPEIPEDFVLVLDDQEVTEHPAETVRNEEELVVVVESDEGESRVEGPIIQEERLDNALEQHADFPGRENNEEQQSHTFEEIYLVAKADDDICEIVDDSDSEQRRSRLGRSKPALQCSICGKQLHSKRTFQSHMTLHSPLPVRQDGNVHCIEESLQVEPVLQANAGEDLYEIVEKTAQPSAAQRTFPNRSRLWKPLNPCLKCQICGKQLSTNNSFKYHMQLHGTATPYVCTICGESFKTRNAHDGHVTLHDRNNPNRCPTCFKVFRQASSLRTHLLIHSGIKPFPCTICGKRLTQKSGQKKHMLTHTGEMPHGCDICGRRFRFSSNLTAHKRCHSQEKPHPCPVCQERSFGSRSELNRHMLVHSSERPFGCEQCGKSFKRRISLGIHRQSHKAGGQRRRAERPVVVQLEEQDEEEQDET
ncbi:zinc finger protein [Drosophila mauritiana]|uniref:Zinc finger protein n=1 Tax=Drosophila mauritiana TaxID=7226 RepID=A0A6P8KS79_DROMA|nr:zinc finger protein [Drosophila mauritiana]